MKRLKNVLLVLVMMVSVFSLSVVKADEINYVAKVGDTEYTTLDEAIAAVKDTDNAVIELLDDVTTEGLNLTKSLTIKSEEAHHYTVTFTKNGIALWGVSLTFENVDVMMENIGSTPYTAEWNWMTICASQNSSLNLIRTTMTMDGVNAGNKHAIYFTGNDKLNLTESNLTIKNYQQDALEWDGGDGGYNINIVDSNFVSDHNRSGITGTFVVTIDHSHVDVVNSTGNGSNGSHYEIKNDSVVNYNNNGAHGLSAGRLTIDHSNVTANYNGGNGIYTNSTLKIVNEATVTVIGNECSISSKWTQPGAVRIGGADSIVDSTTTFTVTDNNGSGIYLTSAATLDLQTGTIVRNIANMLGIGGGIYNNGSVIIHEGVAIYNNHAEVEADDIYNIGELSLPSVVGGSLEKNRADGSYLNDCEDAIDGWYEDGANARWYAHGNTMEENHIVSFKEGTSIKAAHNIKGTVHVHYETTTGEVLTDVIDKSDFVGLAYDTEALSFSGYKLIKIPTNATGYYDIKDIDVIYLYEIEEFGKGGDVELLPPQTGVELVEEQSKHISIGFIHSICLGLFLLIKKFI